MSYPKSKFDRITGSTVLIPDGNVEKALRKFKKKVAEQGKLTELRAREFYEKPTTARKRKKAAARARWRKQLAANELPKKTY